MSGPGEQLPAVVLTHCTKEGGIGSDTDACATDSCGGLGNFLSWPGCRCSCVQHETGLGSHHVTVGRRVNTMILVQVSYVICVSVQRQSVTAKILRSARSCGGGTSARDHASLIELKRRDW